MPTENERTLVDRLGKLSEGRLQQLRDQASAVAPANSGSSLRFKSGDRVIDLATGQSAIVKSAEARAGQGGALFTVELADQRTVFRNVGELAPDQAIAPAPEQG